MTETAKQHNMMACPSTSCPDTSCQDTPSGAGAGSDTGAAKKPYCPPQLDGLLVLNKPSGPSSAACLSKIKRQLGQKKIGHAGTLDPMASGVLLVMLGQATKLSGYLLEGGEKVYSGLIKFGQATDTWDAEGRVLSTAPLDFAANLPGGLEGEACRKLLEDAVRGWEGESEQEVPPYSAAKHQGKPLYELARKGLETPVKTKTIKISRAEPEWVGLPFLRFRVACGSGTYIRSLAHSLGVRLGCGATLMELTREYSHPFGLAQSFTLEELLAQPEKLVERVYPLASAMPGIRQIHLNAAESARVKNGHITPCAEQVQIGEKALMAAEKALLFDDKGQALAIAHSAMVDANGYKGLAWLIERGLWNQ